MKLANRGLLAVTTLLLVAAAPAVAEVKIGVFDPAKLLTNSKMGIKLQEDLNQFRVERESEIKAKGEDLQKRVQQYQATVDNLGSDRREELESDLTQRERDLKRLAQDAERDLQKKRQKAIRDLEREVDSVLQDYARDNGFTIILQRDLCAFSLDSIDISDDLVRLVDARTP